MDKKKRERIETLLNQYLEIEKKIEVANFFYGAVDETLRQAGRQLRLAYEQMHVEIIEEVGSLVSEKELVVVKDDRRIEIDLSGSGVQ